MSCETYIVANGYYVKEKQYTVDLETAWEMLKGKYRHRYTSAYREQDHMVMTQHLLVCPNCGQTLPAYQRFVDPHSFWKYRKKREIDEDGIYELMVRQVMLFKEKRKNATRINRVSEPDSFLCRQCGHRSEKATEVKEIYIEEQNAKIKIFGELNDLLQILEFGISQEKQHSIVFPVKEQIVFDLKKRSVQMEIWDANEERISSKDISEGPEVWRHRMVIQMLRNHDFLLNRVAEAFRNQWTGNVFPYQKEECTVSKLFLLTQFAGVDNKEFYTGIPLEKGKTCVEESFATVVEEINGEESICQMFEKSNLPKVKSVKRVLFQRPYLCFYMKELEILSEILKDTNLLLRMIEPDMVEVLSYLHEYPSIRVFFWDYSQVGGAKQLIYQLDNDLYSTIYYAMGYAAMTMRKREGEQNTWRRKTLNPQQRIQFSRSFPLLSKIPERCEVNGYTFQLLRSSDEYREAGKALNNCLDFHWHADNERGVFVVMKGRFYKAAIEVRKGAVYQAFLYKNAPLEKDKNVERAYDQWVRRCNLRVDSNDCLPFD